MTFVARALVLPIRLYQRLLSPLLGPRCRFYPSCSDYAAQAMLKHGALRGIYLGVRRLLRCHPWNPGGFDDVPETFTWRRTKVQEAA
jgi:putative membrane protein insertion efficiency factor